MVIWREKEQAGPHRGFYARGASDPRVTAITVCLSVCQTPVMYQNGYTYRITQTTQSDIPGSLVFDAKIRWWTTPSPRNLSSKWPTPFQTAQSRPILAHSASTVRAGEKSSISTNRKSTTRFPTSHRWTMYFTPNSPKGWHKTRFCYFSTKFQLLSKKVCYKVSLCKNVKQQSYSYIIPLSNGR